MADGSNGFEQVYASRRNKKAALEAESTAAAAKANANAAAVRAKEAEAKLALNKRRANKAAETKKYVEDHFGPRLNKLLKQVGRPQDMLYGPQKVLSNANKYEMLAQHANAERRNKAFNAAEKAAMLRRVYGKGGKRNTRRVKKSKRTTKHRS